MQILHSLSKERLELVNSLEGYVSERVLPLLKPVDKCWQPADFLPDPSQGDYLDQVRCAAPLSICYVDTMQFPDIVTCTTQIFKPNLLSTSAHDCEVSCNHGVHACIECHCRDIAISMYTQHSEAA